MARQTRLYQPVGSPLIQGRSKRERPFTMSALGGAVLAFGLWAAALAGDLTAGLGILQPTRPAARRTLAALDPVLLVSLAVAAALGGYVGAELARQMGWRGRWKSAAIVAFVLDAIVFLVVR